ncbi:hypothetical protein [Halothermothrix orenii]|uniref:Uncharacterized protein n=1 Tax=Halothermothrix orenii (strain H 168 / OCM 544 / DSM 9562) TaxID=373903 RepID=B8CXQ8_HALOH|nr:hypothetical protein [Halothermothrix orenii]ACL70077.1 hypothetical protein Hore_13270 [Halothermothrix orenii H 168]
MSGKRTVLLDFDGVIHSYTSGWQGISRVVDPPVPGVKKAIEKLRKNYRVVICSSRCRDERGKDAVKEYLNKYGIVVDDIVYTKIPAFVQIDDRALTFEGKWDNNFLNKIKKFKPWTKSHK